VAEAGHGGSRRANVRSSHDLGASVDELRLGLGRAVALSLAGRAYVMDRGRIVGEGPAAAVAADQGPLTL
jgi:hypothetical protein